MKSVKPCLKGMMILRWLNPGPCNTISAWGPPLIKPSCMSLGQSHCLTQHDILQASLERASRFRSPSEAVCFLSAVHRFKVCFVLSELSENRCRFTKTIARSVLGWHTCLQKKKTHAQGGQRNVFLLPSIPAKEIAALVLLYGEILNEVFLH